LRIMSDLMTPQCLAKQDVAPAIRAQRPGMWHKVGLVQIRRFSGNSTDEERALTVQGSQCGAPTIVLGAAEEGVAKHLQPMRVRLPCQELGRGLPHAVGAITALQPVVVEVEL
jgi:hypothetical protein